MLIPSSVKSAQIRPYHEKYQNLYTAKLSCLRTQIGTDEAVSKQALLLPTNFFIASSLQNLMPATKSVICLEFLLRWEN